MSHNNQEARMASTGDEVVRGPFFGPTDTDGIVVLNLMVHEADHGVHPDYVGDNRFQELLRSLGNRDADGNGAAGGN